MLTIIFVVVFLLLFLLFNLSLMVFIKSFGNSMRIICGYLTDCRVDEFARKSTILGEMHSYTKSDKESERVEIAFERGMAIFSDVLLLNGLNPKDWHLRSMIMLSRLALKLALTGKEVKINGKS